MIVVRYADDLVVGFEHEGDARRFLDAMRVRPLCCERSQAARAWNRGAVAAAASSKAAGSGSPLERLN